MTTATPRVGRLTIWASLLVACGCGVGGATTHAEHESEKEVKSPKQVLLIRHAEKTGEKGDIHLSKIGKERADKLDQLFEVTKTRPDPLLKPDFLFAEANSDGSHRPLETISPLADKLKLTVDATFNSKSTTASKGIAGLTDTLFGEEKYVGKTVLVSWRHGSIPELAKALRVKKVPDKWEDDVFDRVWQITYDEKGKATLHDIPQRLLSTDSEK